MIEEDLKIVEKRSEVKAKGEKERYTQWMPISKEQQGKITKPSKWTVQRNGENQSNEKH